jgi:uncharacterized repeat protein (TIGR03803 family)
VYGFAATGDGQFPIAGVIQGTDGNLYGTTYYGGSNDTGTVYKVTLSPTIAETPLYSFGPVSSTDGQNPYAGVVQASDGNLYGLTEAGGTDNYGTAFQYNLTTLTETVLYSFGTSGSDGQDPMGTLIQGSDGNLYGTAFAGGTNAMGTVFGITP